jgi:hypothetical protein
MGKLHRHTLVHKRVVNMTRGGRVYVHLLCPASPFTGAQSADRLTPPLTARRASHYVLTIVGSPEKGLLGIGQGKSPTMAKAADQALSNGPLPPPEPRRRRIPADARLLCLPTLPGRSQR